MEQKTNFDAPAAKSPLHTKLRALVDEVWNHVTQSAEVPSTKTADMLIEKVFQPHEISQKNLHNSGWYVINTITNSYKILLADENPILYTGANVYSQIILGSIIMELESNNLLYFHVIITSDLYLDFLERKITLLEIIQSNPVFIVTKTNTQKIIECEFVKFENIPKQYLPLHNSYLPKA